MRWSTLSSKALIGYGDRKDLSWMTWCDHDRAGWEDGPGEKQRTSVLPSIFFDHVGQLNDVFALLVLLGGLEGMFVLPSQGCFAGFAKDIRNCVKTRKKDSLLRLATSHIDHGIEKVGPSLRSLEGLGDQFVMICQMSPTVNATVGSVAVVQVGLKCLDHGCRIAGIGQMQWKKREDCKAKESRAFTGFRGLTEENVRKSHQGTFSPIVVWLSRVDAKQNDHNPHGWWCR